MLTPILNSRYGTIEALAGRPEGKMALSCGGTSGIGEATMALFAGEGAQRGLAEPLV
jgi:NADP-dependent 3-hydroxy acid dehydrogenase YdfG